VQQSRGCLQLRSVPGEGTEIDLYFPRARLPEDEVPQPAKLDFRALGLSVLVVEDRSGLRATLQRVFTQIGFRTVMVPTAAAALDLLQGGTRVDLLFSDIVLPGPVNGPALATAAERLCPGLVVVLASGDAREVDAAELRWPLLPKPFQVAALVDLLARLPFRQGRVA